MKMNFGKYAGQDMEDVPRDYLEWLHSTNEAFNRQIKSELDRRDMLETAQLTMIEKIVQAGYRELAKRLHPDGGGDAEEFKDLQAANAQLKEVMKEIRGAAVET